MVLSRNEQNIETKRKKMCKTILIFFGIIVKKLSEESF